MLRSTAELERKISDIPPWARNIFREFFVELNDKESNMTLGFLAESRQQLRGELDTIKQEQEELRGSPLPTITEREQTQIDHRRSALARQGVSQDKLQRYLQRKLAEKAPRAASRASSSLSSMSDASLDFDSRPSTSCSRADTFYKDATAATPVQSPPRKSATPAPRASPNPPRKISPAPPPKSPETAKKELQEKTEELLAAAEQAETKQESERERQWEKVRRAKERRKQRHQAQAALASQMMDLAREVAEMQNREKAKQEQKIKDRLDEIRKKKEDGN